MTRIVALLLCLCSTGALAQAPSRLERGNGPEPATLDAHGCQEVACGNILRDLYEGLVTEDAAGRLIPGMAERWETSADGRVWTFHLRDDLRWSNGETLDAPQIVASFRRAFAPETAAPFASQFDAVLNAAAVQAGRATADRAGHRRARCAHRAHPHHATDAAAGAADPAHRVSGVPARGRAPRAPAHPAGASGQQRRLSTGSLDTAGEPDAREESAIPRCRQRAHRPRALPRHRGRRRRGCSATPPAICTSPKPLPPQPLAKLRARYGAQLRVSRPTSVRFG
jgi:oligopeptide transport system substrate-binding protein